MKNALLLWGIALLIIVAPLAALSLTACETARDRVAAGAGALVDCEAPSLKAAVAELVPVFELAVIKLIRGDGSVDTTKLRAAGAAILGNLGRCALASAVAILTAPASDGQSVIAQPLLVPDPGALRAAFESIRGEWGGGLYRTSAGIL